MVVSDRNIHSSIIYQGVVGDLGIDTVCQVNSASMIPDLVFWIDCDPDRAIDRIKHATLRMSSDKQEYFETPEIQKTIRKGFHDLFTGTVAVAPPFDKCCVVGPILNEGGLDELRQKLRKELPNKDMYTLKAHEGGRFPLHSSVILLEPCRETPNFETPFGQDIDLTILSYPVDL